MAIEYIVPTASVYGDRVVTASELNWLIIEYIGVVVISLATTFFWGMAVKTVEVVVK